MGKYKIIGYVLFVAFLSLFSTNIFAANIFLESSKSNISVGDTVIVSAKINSEGVTINTIEGDIVFKTGGNNIIVQEFSLANSSFGLWPKTPSLSKDGQVISFVGGVPGGFNIEGATIFKIILEAKKEGTITISPQNIIAFANDGNGTKLPVKVGGIVIKVGSKKTGNAINDEWKALVAEDITPPEDFIAVLGKDDSLFEGKKFVYFSALDNQSGISYYEVSENGTPSVRSGSTYVLQNQDSDIKLKITAYDKAGNKKTIMYNPDSISWVSIIFVVILIILGKLFYKKIRKNKYNVFGK